MALAKQLLLFSLYIPSSSLLATYPWFHGHKKEWCERSLVNKGSFLLGDLICDALHLGKNIFSVDSAKVITGFLPGYLLTRWVDEAVQECFYDRSCHKNINQWPSACHQVAQKGVAVPMVFLSSLALWGWNEDIRQTGRLTFIGLPFVQSGKDIIKQAEFKSCLRPWHENFDSRKRASGGFPSGHTANVVYMTTLWWMRQGPRWGIPLSLFSAFVMADFVNCNRHYVSQIVAGAGLGVLVALAANKVVEHNLKRCSVSFESAPDGSCKVCVGVSF